MIDQLNKLWDLLAPLLESGQPSLVILVNVLIIGAVIGFVVWRVKSELRGLKWNQLTFADRRRIIEDLLREAIETAEWMYSHLEPAALDEKKKVATLKRKTAITYATRELRAAGAAQQDVNTLKLRLEKVFAAQHPDKIRYGATVAPAIKIE